MYKNEYPRIVVLFAKGKRLQINPNASVEITDKDLKKRADEYVKKGFLKKVEKPAAVATAAGK